MNNLMAAFQELTRFESGTMGFLFENHDLSVTKDHESYRIRDELNGVTQWEQDTLDEATARTRLESLLNHSWEK